MLKSSGLSYPNEVMRCSTDVQKDADLVTRAQRPVKRVSSSKGLHAQALEYPSGDRRDASERTRSKRTEDSELGSFSKERLPKEYNDAQRGIPQPD